MSRTQLFQFRLLATAAALLIVYALLRFLWFPGGYFALAGIGKLLLVLLAVNVVAGPALSALVYKPGKPGLKFDPVALTGPELVYAELPQDNEALSRLIDETLFAGLPDIDRRTEYWKPYPEGIGALRAVAEPLARLLTMNDEQAALVRRWVARRGAPIDDYVYLPVRARNGDGTMIMHADSGYPVEVLATDPWPDAPGEAP